MRLRSYLIVLVLATVVPLVVFATIVVVLFSRHERAMVERGAIETARAVVSAVDRELLGVITTLEALATSRSLDAGDVRGFREDARRVLATRSEWLTINLAAADGEQVVNLGLPPGAPLPAAVEPASLLEVVRTGRPAVGNLALSPLTGEQVVAVRVPVTRAGRVRYVLSAVFRPVVFAHLLVRQRVPEGWVGTIVDRTRVVVARTRAPDRFVARPASADLQAALDRAGEGWVAGRALEGDLVYAAFSRSDWSGWTVALGVPGAAVGRPLRRSLALLVAGGLALVLLGIALAMVVGRRIAAPIVALARAAEALGRGEPVRDRAPGPLAEVEIVARAMDTAAAARAATEAALEDTAATLHALVDSSALAIVVMDTEAMVQIWNPAAEAMLGWSAAEAVGRRPPHLGEDEWPGFEQNFAVALRGAVFRGEAHRRRKDGSPIDLAVATAPLRDAAGRIRGVVTVFADITERRRAEEERSAGEKLVRAVLEGTDDAVFLKDREGRYLVVNPAGCRALGRPLAEILGRADTELYPPAVAREVREHDRLVMESGEAHRFELTIPGPGGPRTYLSTKSPRRDAEGNVVGVISISRDVTDWTHAEHEREQLLAREQALRVEAERANRAKDEFLAMLGHELRNPLGAITNAIAALEHRGLPGERAAALRTIVARQTRHLARLVDDLLDVSRLSSSKVTLRRRPVDLHEIAQRCLAARRDAADAGEREVRLEGGPAVVEGDPTRLEQVVGNLLDNALKFTPAGGRVELRVEREGSEALLRVRDTGVGIPADELPRVFDAFVQGQGSLDRPQGGLGLGLTLVRRLVELHGGTVEASSGGPGRGSEFVVRLPAPAGVTGAALAGVPPRAGAIRPDPPPSRRVVVVEDHPDAREGLRLLLELWGHRVEEAADGEAGLALLLASRPDIALVDLGLPRRDGYALARAVRAAPGGEGIFLVALTGYGQPEDRRRVAAAGFDAHLVKPVEPADLERVLAGAFGASSRGPAGLSA